MLVQCDDLDLLSEFFKKINGYAFNEKVYSMLEAKEDTNKKTPLLYAIKGKRNN